ncbi:Protein of unknown function [Bacillus mycoides]|nr:Protein of unknown function [Bacillus mycoides]SCC25160.1 Protein of unknown function [Bacillus mycoides]
MQKEMHDV